MKSRAESPTNFPFSADGGVLSAFSRDCSVGSSRSISGRALRGEPWRSIMSSRAESGWKWMPELHPGGAILSGKTLPFVGGTELCPCLARPCARSLVDISKLLVAAPKWSGDSPLKRGTGVAEGTNSPSSPVALKSVPWN